MNNQMIAEIKLLLESPENIVVVPHKNPDGDAIGATLALRELLSILGHDVTVISPNDFPGFLKWMPGASNIMKFDHQKKKSTDIINKAKIIFTLDFNHLSRAGCMQGVLEQTNATFIMIDHHQQPDSYANYTISDVSMSSTAQMVYHFIEELSYLTHITPQMAGNMYTGIMTDTGSFRYRSTTSTTHRVIADLIDRGAQHDLIHEQIYNSYTLNRLKLKGLALQNLRVLHEYNTAYITLSQDELEAYDFKKGDTEGFVNLGLSISTVQLALIFIENKSEGIIKISLRSKGNFSVNEMAREHFEGGGHRNAAGGKSNHSLDETIEQFITILPKYKNLLNS